MKLILTADVDHLGATGDTVEVKDGYGRNYLLPRGLAIVATKGAEKHAADIRRARETKLIHDREHAAALKDEIIALGPITVQMETANESGKLFGSVTAGDIAVAIRRAGGPKLEKHIIHLPKLHIKKTGTYKVGIHLHHNVQVELSLEVVPHSR